MKTKEELLKLYNLPLEELLKEAKKYTFEEFEFCSLISARTGKCSQNCKYCSQSTHYNTDIYTHPLVSVEEVVKTAKESKENGAINFAIVTSGKTPDEAKDFDELLKMMESQLMYYNENIKNSVWVKLKENLKIKDISSL